MVDEPASECADGGGKCDDHEELRPEEKDNTSDGEGDQTTTVDPIPIKIDLYFKAPKHVATIKDWTSRSPWDINFFAFKQPDAVIFMSVFPKEAAQHNETEWKVVCETIERELNSAAGMRRSHLVGSEALVTEVELERGISYLMAQRVGALYRENLVYSARRETMQRVMEKEVDRASNLMAENEVLKAKCNLDGVIKVLVSLFIFHFSF
jgi:hypothetical protein